MNPSTNHAPDRVPDSQPLASALPRTRPMVWSVRRELWENRYLTIAPLVVTAIVLFASLISIARLPHRLERLPADDLLRQQATMVRVFRQAPAPIMMATLIVGLFYCLDALYGERRDRSILFWKSMPVSDRTTVLSKAGIPLVVLPLMALGLSIATQFALMPFASLVLAGSGWSPVPLWSEFQFVEGPMVMLYGLGVHALWFAPVYGWLLLISAWARRAPLLWAVLPLLAVSAVEAIALSSWKFMSMLQYRMTGAMKEAFIIRQGPEAAPGRIWDLDPARFLTRPGLWIGLVFAAACLAMAVRVRRNREPL